MDASKIIIGEGNESDPGFYFQVSFLRVLLCTAKILRITQISAVYASYELAALGLSLTLIYTGVLVLTTVEGTATSEFFFVIWFVHSLHQRCPIRIL